MTKKLFRETIESTDYNGKISGVLYRFGRDEKLKDKIKKKEEYENKKIRNNNYRITKVWIDRNTLMFEAKRIQNFINK